MKTLRVTNTMMLKIDQPVLVGKYKKRTNIVTIYSDIDIACDNGNLYDLSIHKVLINI